MAWVMPAIYAGGMALKAILGGQYQAKQAQRQRILDALTQEMKMKQGALQQQQQGVQDVLQKTTGGYMSALR